MTERLLLSFCELQEVICLLTSSTSFPGFGEFLLTAVPISQHSVNRLGRPLCRSPKSLSMPFLLPCFSLHRLISFISRPSACVWLSYFYSVTQKLLPGKAVSWGNSIAHLFVFLTFQRLQSCITCFTFSEKHCFVFVCAFVHERERERERERE